MIYTVTLNPSIDYVVTLADLKLGEVNRLKTSTLFPGGKGINVSRILQQLEIENTALGFVGGFTGGFVEQVLTEDNLKSNFSIIEDNTRINVKLHAREETEINGEGPNITIIEQEDLFQKLERITPNDTVILAGSTPPSLGAGFYEKLIEIIKRKGAQFVIDTTGSDLQKALNDQPILVKPNHHELAALYDTSFDKLSDIFPYGEQLLKDGAKFALISMAGDGALFFDGQHIYLGKAVAQPVENSVGAGDSMIAGFIGELSKSDDPLSAFKMGLACGSATAYSKDLAKRDMIEQVLAGITIEKLQ